MMQVERTDFASVPVQDMERARRLFEFHGEILDSGVCHIAFFGDLDGNALALHRRYAPYADGTEP